MGGAAILQRKRLSRLIARIRRDLRLDQAGAKETRIARWRSDASMVYHLQKPRRLAMRPQKFAVLVMGSCLAAFASTQVGAQSALARNHDIEGAWMVTTTPRDCATGITFPQAAFANLLMFHEGGTMSASVPSSSMVTRTLGHGLWRHETGWSNYSFTFVHLRYDSSMAYTGRQVATGTLVLNENGNEFTTESRTSVFDTNGNPLGGGCGNSVGIRFELP